MNFKEAILENLSRNNLNEMALKHLKGTDKYWENGDIKKIADDYIKNAREDGKDDTAIIRGLSRTFRADNKKFSEKPELYKKEYMPKIKQAIKEQLRPEKKVELKKTPEYVKLKEFVDKELENKDNSEDVKGFLKGFKKYMERKSLSTAKKEILYILFNDKKYSAETVAIARKIYDFTIMKS